MEYYDFKNFIELTGVYEKLPSGTKHGFKSVKPALIRMTHAVLCAAMWVGITQIIGLDPNYCGTKEFVTEGNLAWRFFYINVAGTAQRGYFYFSWCLSDAACILAGFTFNGFDKEGEATWDRICCVLIWQFEFSPSMVAKSRAWNH